MFDLIAEKIERENIVHFERGKEFGKEIDYYYFLYKNEVFVEIWLNENDWFYSIDNFRDNYGNKNLNEVLTEIKEELCN